jgi:uncharacterized membrane protein
MIKKYLIVLAILISLILSALPSTGSIWVDDNEITDTKINLELGPETELTNDQPVRTRSITSTFGVPTTKDVDGFVAVYMDGTTDLEDGGFGKPLIPYKTETLKFQPGTEILEVNFNPDLSSSLKLDKKLIHSQDPNPISQLDYIIPQDDFSVDYGPLLISQPDPQVYGSADPYPSEWFSYRTGMGLDPETDERTLFLSVKINPLRYRPGVDTIDYLTSADIEVLYQDPADLRNVEGAQNAGISDPHPLVEYDMIVITPAAFTNNLQPLVDHKKNTSIDVKVVTLTDIDTGVYFPKQGVDQQEQIKYFIKEAIENWNITYVILVGDIDKMVFRKAIIHGEGDGDVPSDLYFADIYDSQMNFCNWDTDGDGIYGEWNANNENDIDHADLYPDVYLGRLPASTTFDVDMFVDKIVNYELNAAADVWFQEATLVGLDTFNEGSGVYEGEYAADHIGDNYLTGFTQTKLYQSLGTCTNSDIKAALNKGSGFATFHDHGNIDSWAGKISGADMLGLTNGDKLSFMNFDACLTGAFDSNDCIAEDAVLNYNGGAITSIGASRIGYGMWGAAHITRYSGYFNIRLYKNYDDGIAMAGKILDAAKLDYLKNIGVHNFADYKTIVEFNLFGDPTLSVGGIPIKFFNITSEDNIRDLNPGESTNYTVMLSNNGKFTRTIKLYVDGEPSGWGADLNESSVAVPAGKNYNVTLTVTVPEDELANTVGAIDVFAYISTNKDKTISVTTFTTVNRIYGVELDLKPGTSYIFKMNPEENKIIDVVIWNHGNDVDTIDLNFPTFPEEWVMNYVDNGNIIEDVTIDPHNFKVVYLNLTVPEKALVGSYPVISKGSLQGTQSHVNDTLPITVSINRVYGVEILCPTKEYTVEPGDDVTYDIQINHTGNDVDIVKITVNNVPQNWTMSLSHEDNFLIDPYATQIATLEMSVPEDEVAGIYPVDVTVEISGDGSKTKIVTATTIERYFGFNVTCFVDTFDIEGGETYKHKIYLENLGNGIDSIDMKVLKKPQNWNIKLSRTEDITLAAYEDTSVEVTVIPPKFALAGEYNISIEARLDGDGAVKYINTTGVIEEIYDFAMNMAITQYNVDPGISAKFVVELVNDGNVVDYVNLSVLDLPDNWKTSVGTGKIIELEPFSSTVEIVTITSYSEGNAGEYGMEIIGTLTSDETSEYIPVKVIVIQYFDVELGIEDKEKIVEPNTEVSYNITITNDGNGIDGIYREVVGLPNALKDDIHFPLEYKYELAPGETRKEVLRILVPKDYKGDYINISVLIYSEGDSAKQDKVNATTIVEKKTKAQDGSDGQDYLSTLFPYILIFIIILIILILIGVVISRRNQRIEHMEREPPPRRRSPPPPPPPRSRGGRRADRAIAGLGGRRDRRGRRHGSRRGRRPRDKVRWRGSELDEDETGDLTDEEFDEDYEDEDEDEEVYDMDAEAEEDESETDWDEEEDDEDTDWDEDEVEDDDADWDEDEEEPVEVEEVEDVDDEEEIFEIELDDDVPEREYIDWE